MTHQLKVNRLGIQEELDSLKTAEERNIIGQFATPPALALDITKAVSEFVDDGQIRFLEPALGTGAFFEAALSVFGAKLSKATGVEVDLAFVNASKDIWRDTNLDIVFADFTALDPSDFDKATVLITNPPYVRHHHIGGDQKRRLVNDSFKATGISLSGLAGLYVHFMFHAHRWLAEDAVSAWLIPSEFMDVNYGEGLKRYLTQNVELLRIHRFCPEDVQFNDALVTSTVVIFRNREPSLNLTVRYTFGPSLASPSRESTVTLSELRSVRKWSQLPRIGTAVVEVPYVTVGDAFKIRRGLATGDNSFFIRPLKEFVDIGIPQEFLKPMLPSPRALKNPVVTADSEGYPDVEPKLALLDCPLPEQEVEARYPEFWKYLLEGKEKQVCEGYLCRGRKPWYSQEKRDPPPIVCTYMGRKKEGEAPFRFIENHSDAVATNLYILLYPKPWLVDLERKTPGLLSRVYDYLRSIKAESFIAEGRVYGGGLHKMEPRELARLPLDIPELTEDVRHSDTIFP